MAAKKNFLGLVDAGREIRRPPLVGVQFLHERAVGSPDVRIGSARFKPQDLMRLFFGHRAMARRLSAPKTRIFIDVFTPAGNPAVEISFE